MCRLMPIAASLDEAVRGAQGGYLPRVDVGLGWGREKADNSSSRVLGTQDSWLHRREASVTASQMIFDSFATYNEVAQPKRGLNHPPIAWRAPRSKSR